MLKKAILKDIVEGSMGKRFPIYSETKKPGFSTKLKVKLVPATMQSNEQPWKDQK